MVNVLFICHGNICRSPMAEFVFRDIAAKCGCENEFLIASAATSDENVWNGVGAPVYPQAKAELFKHGLTCEEKRAVQLRKDDYGKYDMFVCMDSSNVRNSLRIFGGDPENKITRLMSWAGEERDVSDPWYTRNFTVAYDDIVTGCTALFERLYND